ncbi:putative bifunctional diguanylate cyclase/phosphodiesterase [Methylomonas fluvii]|uniref:EAL domain-containing protein n=1 Tax=Methylomonas fluvii TaxID=1854564 RepID=A0ABR9DGZ1_9GAMM|nr:EAL domain-containing protein [Methylomonas fluvii]MBD9362370.1 EAL domain-containing protein [Methylomonas fluvii]CAD6875462.1 diguanylate cyclase/phosphodiesterase (GGDEF & EAL domains) with PAS/PAC sensor(s) [Methylomonas fluvii]
MKKRHDGSSNNSGELRQRAERQLAETAPKSASESQHRLMHELQVHQIELQMQNEALQEARTSAEQALLRYAELFDFAPVAYFTLAKDGSVQQTNFNGERMLGIERYKITGRHFANIVASEYRPVFRDFLEKVFANPGSQHCEIVLEPGGHPRWVTVEAIADSHRQTCLAAMVDISERKSNERELQLAATVYLAIEEAILVADTHHKIIAVNPAFTKLTGYSSAEAIGQNTSLLKSSRHDEAFFTEMWKQLNSTGQWLGEIWNQRKNGSEYLARLSISTVYGDNGRVIRRVAMASDITEQRRAEALIHQQANIDPLTGLPNRRMFLDHLQRAINKSHREHQKLALMFMDLDHFKDINDTLGHDVGDRLLKETTQRLTSCIRDTDTLARPGGDEFTLIMSELHEINSIDRVAQAMLRTMTAPFQLNNERCYVSVSIGIALYPDDADTMEDLLKKADQAMYAAKDLGRSRFCYFTPAMQEAAEIRLRLTNDLRHALTDNQIWVAYQPIVDLATGEIKKAEALVRWQHPTRGLVSPAEFIPIAEDSGLIAEIGSWVFHQVANQVAKWRVNHHSMFQISINKSPAQFHNNSDKMADWFEHLNRLGLPGGCIAVEITEGLLLDNSSVVSDKLLAFKDAGMQTSLDDFGTGYSSLSYLKKYHIDFLKIDQAFVSNLVANSTDMALCEAIIAMAHVLGMKVIAEGVETVEQRDLLIKAGCDYGQGYLFSKPVTAEEFEKLFPVEKTESVASS